MEYVPFGEVFIEERNNTWNTPYLFNGKELDEETGLYYYGARYYNPRISIFYGVDPLVEETMLPYAYAANNPVRFIDWMGMSPQEPEKSSVLNDLKLTMKEIGKLVSESGEKAGNAIISILNKADQGKGDGTQPGGVEMTGGAGSPGVSAENSKYIGDVNEITSLAGGVKGPGGANLLDLATSLNKVKGVVEEVNGGSDVRGVSGSKDQKRIDNKTGFGEGRYSTWTKRKGGHYTILEEASGDSVLLINGKDSTLYVDPTKSEAEGYNWRVIKPLSSKK